ncbi:hypothetical protein HanPSC8_Chr11g0462701 [Helianthus annuus]|nr:hypothetical protein HanPSC8_Chr11g0462701 [Helianthus annuus]
MTKMEKEAWGPCLYRLDQFTLPKLVVAIKLMLADPEMHGLEPLNRLLANLALQEPFTQVLPEAASLIRTEPDKTKGQCDVKF